MAPTPIEESLAELNSLKQRRQQLDTETAALKRDLAAAIERARAARLSMREIAQHAGVERTTLYSHLKRAKQQRTPTQDNSATQS